MDIQKIKEANTKILGKNIEYFPEITSTNLYAKQELKQKKEKNKIWIADMQTSGMGTKGRKWYTGKGKNIAMTILLTPNCNIKKLEGITIKIAKCMQKAIYNLYNLKLDIKEPNDLLYKGKKVSGTLTEISTIGETVNYILIGIGVNVNEDKFNKETENIATSLKKELGTECSREEIIIKFLEILESEIGTFLKIPASGDF